VLKFPGRGDTAPSRGQPKRKHLALHGSTLLIKDHSTSFNVQCIFGPSDAVLFVERWADSDCNLKLSTARRTFWLTFETLAECERWKFLIAQRYVPSQSNKSLFVRAEVLDKVALAGVDVAHHGANPLFEEEDPDEGIR
jgi:hypothetical protein